ncbi:RNA-directed DNA polymerase from mobile element jockey [Trichonephila clavipes]|nr:RNA-directed DNA polymerase from mobile element jockey [Trichonephila clavipes]
MERQRHWGCISNNQRGLLLKNFTDDTDTDLLAPPTPTRFGYNSASTIDFALTRHFHWRTSINSVSELSSDHNPIILNFKTSIKFDFPTRTVTTDWNLLDTPSKLPLHSNQSQHTREDIEKLTADITSNILHAYDLSSKPIQNKNKTFIDSDLKSLFKQRNRARKTWQFTRDPNDKTILNRLQNKIHRKVNALSQKQWEDKLTSLDPEDGSLWNMAKGFRKKRSPISALTGPTGIAYTDAQKAETLANALEDQFQLNNIQNPDTDTQHMRLVDRFFINDNNFDDTPISTKPSELLQYIKKLKIKKAPGNDKITNKMVLNFPISIIFQLTNLINKILYTGHFPQAWKTATVIPILKPGKDPTLATSHRPISLLPVLSKLAERIILNRLNDHLQKNDILIPQQHGFRANLSTSHQLLRVVEYVKTGFAENKSTGAVFLDIQKAFDRVWHYGLLYKLIRTNTPYLIKIIKSFLENRNFSVLVNHSYSPLKNISAGVPQGALLSPTLFNIYVNDIPRTSFSTICLYADDTAVLVQNANLQILAHQLHKHLARLEHWLSTWKIALNVEKTEQSSFLATLRKNHLTYTSKTNTSLGLRAPNTWVLPLIKDSLSDNTLYNLEKTSEFPWLKSTP